MAGLMRARFLGNCLPCLIGSLPLTDYSQAADLVWEHTPEIPLWVQLPKVPSESITRQFAAGLPGLGEEGGRVYVDAGCGTRDRPVKADRAVPDYAGLRYGEPERGACPESLAADPGAVEPDQK